MIPIVVLISGNGSNLQAIIDKCHMKTVEIKAVISDNHNAHGLKRAEEAGIVAISMEQLPNESRESYCTFLDHQVAAYNPEMIILAGFMKVLTPNFVKQYPNKILNIHPSLLPKYPGLHTHQKVVENGDSKHGITIHIVNEVLDGGPILLQQAFYTCNDNEDELEEKIHQLEHKWYPAVINLLANRQQAIRST